MVELSVIMQLRSIENIHYAKTYYSIELIIGCNLLVIVQSGLYLRILKQWPQEHNAPAAIGFGYGNPRNSQG